MEKIKTTAHIMVELPNGRTMCMDEEALRRYKAGEFDPTKPKHTPEEQARIDQRRKEVIERYRMRKALQAIQAEKENK